MEKCILRIKLKTPGTQICTSNPPDRGNTAAGTDIISSSEEYIPQCSRKNMRRKRAHKVYQKKGKVKLLKDPSSDLVSTEDNFNSEPADDKLGSENDPEPPNGSNTPSIMSNIDTEVPNDRPSEKVGHGRVKVKLKSSRVSEAYRSSSDAQTPSEAEKSNPQVMPNMIEAAGEKEESTYSDGQTSEMQNAVLEKLPRKAGNIKIKSSRGMGFSSETMNDRNLGKLVIPSQIPGKKNSVADAARTLNSSPVSRNLRQKEKTLPYKDPRYNERELSAALEVIKKIMKMDAAVPFNTPVDPVALGIPDYFDIIDTPMDFGTISNNLENGLKYMNSEDVFKDVQYIWDNCYKYNNKGDYVVDLMKRVKKNFMKYWLAAGLYSDPAGVPESSQIEDVSRSGLGLEKLHPKSKSKHKRRRYGIDKHKSDCLCAVCVVRRRRKEREENSAAAENIADASDFNISQDLKQEESSPLDIPFGEDATSSLDHTPETDANADGEEAFDEEKMEKEDMYDEMDLDPDENGGNNQSSQHSFENDIEYSKSQFRGQYIETTQPGDQIDATALRNKELSAQCYFHVNEIQEEPCEQTQLSKMQGRPVQQENHLVLQLCRSLFPSDPRSIWNGAHSLSRRNVSFRNSPIHSALETFMK
ncbi:bromodomain-containing protein [Canna indica]|uniref:Bromodomain-containing protein n=1 Tax=Canna indica TaxID=4628 RepID=A0AAQ3JW73_9LILI|nr:bromodomain-containing protein [Canna indica]